MTPKSKLGPRPSRNEAGHTWFRCGPDSPLRGLLFTFEKQGAKYECVVQAHHRIVPDPALLHESLRAFCFVDGVATLTPTKLACLKAILQGLDVES